MLLSAWLSTSICHFPFQLSDIARKTLGKYKSNSTAFSCVDMMLRTDSDMSEKAGALEYCQNMAVVVPHHFPQYIQVHVSTDSQHDMKVGGSRQYLADILDHTLASPYAFSGSAWLMCSRSIRCHIKFCKPASICGFHPVFPLHAALRHTWPQGQALSFRLLFGSGMP